MYSRDMCHDVLPCVVPLVPEQCGHVARGGVLVASEGAVGQRLGRTRYSHTTTCDKTRPQHLNIQNEISLYRYSSLTVAWSVFVVLRGELPPDEEEVRGLETAGHDCLPTGPSTPPYTSRHRAADPHISTCRTGTGACFGMG